MRTLILLFAAAVFAGCTMPAPFANLGANSARSAQAQGEGDGEDGGVDCEDGLTASGAECDGGPGANQDGADEDDGSDGECEDGVDENGQPCSDSDTGGED